MMLYYQHLVGDYIYNLLLQALVKTVLLKHAKHIKISLKFASQ